MPIKKEGSEPTVKKPREKKEELVNTPEEMFRKTFTVINEPGQKPILPKNLSGISSDALSDLMLTYAAWRELTEDMLVEALTDFTRKKEKHQFKSDMTFLKQSASTVKEKEILTRTDLEVRELYLSLMDAELFYTMLSDKRESYNNCLTVISREITRRTNKDA